MANIRYFPAIVKDNEIFSILIPSWNNLPILKITINSILKNSRYKHQIIVHVNEGSDGTAEWLSSMGIAHTISEKNVGVCYGFNIPFSLASCEYIVLSDDDNYFCPDWDYYLYEAIKKQPDQMFCISGTLIEHSSSNNPCVLAPYDFGRTEHDFDEERLLREFDQIPFQDWNGSNWYPMVLHRNVWTAVGGLSIEFTPGMWSDPDFMMKLYHFGVRRFKGIAASRAYHFMSRTTSRVKRNNGHKTFLLKWGLSSGYFMKKVLGLGQSRVEPKPQKQSFKQKLKGLMAIPDNISETRL